LTSYEKASGILSLGSEAPQENYMNISSRASINYTVSGSNIRIELTTGSNGANQNWRVFVNIKGYS